MSLILLVAYLTLLAFGFCIVFYISSARVNVLNTFLSLSFFVAAIAAYFMFDSYKGWPADMQVPKKSAVVAVQILHKTDITDPAIYVWAYPLPDDEDQPWWKFLEYKFSLYPAPRSYYIPYSDEAAKKFNKAKQALGQGQGVMMKNNGKHKQPPGWLNEDYQIPELEIFNPSTMLKKDE